MTATRTPCPTCQNPSDAARFIANWLRGNRAPSLAYLFDAAKHDLEVAEADADAAASAVLAAEGQLAVSNDLATAAAARAEREAKDAAQSGLPLVVAEQVRASADAAQLAAARAEREATDAGEKLSAATATAADKRATVESIRAATFTPDELTAAFAELGVVVDGSEVYPIDQPNAEQARTRSLLGF